VIVVAELGFIERWLWGGGPVDRYAPTVAGRLFVAAQAGFMVPYAAYALSMGSEPVYRGVQVLYLMVLVALLVLTRARFSRVSLLVVGVALLFTAASEFQLIVGLRDGGYTGAVMAAQFALTILALDRVAARSSLADFGRLGGPAAALLLVASTIHLAFFSTKVWGRALFFGMHPNLGGELIFACVAFVAFYPRMAIRLLLYVAAVFCLMTLQSRAALIATVAYAVGIEATRRRPSPLALVLMVVVAVAGLVFVNVTGASAGLTSLLDTALLLNDPYRGTGTGFVGRGETWAYALDVFKQHPFMGAGLGETHEAENGVQIHSGYLRLLAEFGIGGVLLNALILWRAVQNALAQRWAVVILIACCAFMYAFCARSIASNAFPLLLWVALLPWVVGPRATPHGHSTPRRASQIAGYGAYPGSGAGVRRQAG
jgi:hypothetical protein